VNSDDSQRHGLARNFALAILIMALVLVADQVTKAIILDRLGPTGDLTQIKIIPGFLRLIYVENTGAAFGMFQGKSPVLTIIALLVILFLLIYFRRAIAQSVWLSVALGLQLGGAIGNVVDRFRHGFVVDFINFPKFPTFNVADSAITVGVVMLGLYLLTRDPAAASHEERTVRGGSAPTPDTNSAENQAP
jgi:signal peptidase II